jgi:glutaredoxin
MKSLIRTFFKLLRTVIAPFILLWEWLTTPKGVLRAPEKQRQIDAECRGLALYQYKTCPFCVKVRREMRRLSLNIDLLDVQHNAQNRAELLQGGGKTMVPCLKLTDAKGNSTWMYESAQIIQYLHSRFA